MARGITQTDVWQAADALLLEGARPTIERVRQKIGSGSPNTVSPHLETWFKHLGARIKDPGAFAAPSDVPDPVLAVAKHLWESAQAEARREVELQVNERTKVAVANVEAEKERASIASASAFEATARANRLQAEMDAILRQRDEAQQALAAEQARVEELRHSLDIVQHTLRAERERATGDVSSLNAQLESALSSADAADRRVAFELDRERTARTQAERRIEQLIKSTDHRRDLERAELLEANAQLEAGREREQNLRAQYAAVNAELIATRQQLSGVQALHDEEVGTGKVQIANLQSALERLTTAVELGGRTDKARVARATRATRKA